MTTKIIDAHAHLLDEKNYTQQLLAEMDRNNIEKCCISGLGARFHQKSNADVEQLLKTHPDRFIGSFFIRPGIDSHEIIEQAYHSGFKILKVTIPTLPYDEPQLFPLWQAASDLKMPVLFHTGVVTVNAPIYGEYISSWYMHPMRLEPIANAFPKLNIIIAHLGVHWNQDAAELTRMRSNVYVDLTGEPNGWRVRADSVGMNSFLWWSGAFCKVIFGTDVHASKIGLIIKQDINRLDTFHIDNETRELIFRGNISRLIGGL